VREVIGDAPDRTVVLLCDDDPLHVTWSRFGPGRDGADPHVHRHHTDLFLVLDGELAVELADGEVTVPAGTLVRVPPMVVHGFRNAAADRELQYLNVHAPGTGFADYMRGLRDGRRVPFDQLDPPATGTRPSSEAVIGGAEDLGGGVLRHCDTPEVAVYELAGDGDAPDDGRAFRVVYAFAGRRVEVRA
jgi:mannose-6-phosphate isomerase-like protein (cupin superfamily)